ETPISMIQWTGCATSSRAVPPARILGPIHRNHRRCFMYQRILVPVDGSSTSMKGLEQAIEMARLTQARLRLIHVIDELSFALAMDAYSGCYTREWLGTLRENGARILTTCKEKTEAAGIEADTVLCDTLKGSVHDRVTSEAANWPADLIVLGTHGRRGAKRLFLGSSAEHILRLAPVPVLLVRAPEDTEAGEERKEDSTSEQQPLSVSPPSSV